MAGRKRLASPTNEKRMKNLKQHQNKADDVLDDVLENILQNTLDQWEKIDYEPEIAKRISEFEKDYDMSDMKVNDMLVLRQLIQAIIALEELETVFTVLRQHVTNVNVLVADKVSAMMTRLRSDISNMQGDLKLTRKARKESQEETFSNWLDITKRKARKFYDQRHLYIFCPECRRLLATVWLLYPKENNTLHLECGNSECKHQFSIELINLYKTDNKNLKDVVIP